MEHQNHQPDPVPPAGDAPADSTLPLGHSATPPLPSPSDRDILLALRGIDVFNSIIAGHKVEASKALLEMALDKTNDPAERRKCAAAIMRAPFQRYPSAAAINGPQPPKSKRRKDDDDPDNNGDDDGGDDQPPSPPDDLMRAYDHGYWNGYATRHWPKPTVETIEETLDIIASHAPGREEPLQSDNLPELPYTHRHPRGAVRASRAIHASRATDGRFLRPSVRAALPVPSIAATAIDANRCRGLPVLRQATRSTHHPSPRPPPQPSVVQEPLLLEQCSSPRAR